MTCHHNQYDKGSCYQVRKGENGVGWQCHTGCLQEVDLVVVWTGGNTTLVVEVESSGALETDVLVVGVTDGAARLTAITGEFSVVDCGTLRTSCQAVEAKEVLVLALSVAT